MADPFTAEIRIFAGNFAPRGWAFCDGQLLPISQNTALFSLIGTTYGGDGRTTTALPDMQGRAPMGPRRGPGLTMRRLGQRTGVEEVVLSEAQMPNHSHSIRANGVFGNQGSPKDHALANTTLPLYTPNTTTMVGMADAACSSTGGSQGHNNMQPYLVMNFIIALVGVYPSRN